MDKRCPLLGEKLKESSSRGSFIYSQFHAGVKNGRVLICAAPALLRMMKPFLQPGWVPQSLHRVLFYVCGWLGKRGWASVWVLGTLIGL